MVRVHETKGYLLLTSMRALFRTVTSHAVTQYFNTLSRSTELYDPSVYLCCGDGHRVIRSSHSSQCCGDSAEFDPDRQTCCEGHALDVVNGSCCMIGSNRYEAYSPIDQKCCERRNMRGPSYGMLCLFVPGWGGGGGVITSSIVSLTLL